jgi:hypothetical protein
MVTIHAYIALTALGCIAFLAMAVRGTLRDRPTRVVPTVEPQRKAA